MNKVKVTFEMEVPVVSEAAVRREIREVLDETAKRFGGEIVFGSTAIEVES